MILEPKYYEISLVKNNISETKKIKLYNANFTFDQKFTKFIKKKDNLLEKYKKWEREIRVNFSLKQQKFLDNHKLLNYTKLPRKLKINFTEKIQYTNAWRKIYEICSMTKFIPDKKRIRHLDICGFPGAFILAINHFLKSKNSDIEYDWFIQSYKGDENQYFKDNFGLSKKYPQRLLTFHKGDITDLKEINKLSSYFEEDKCDIITSDCGLFLEKHSEISREEQMIKIFYYQYITGIKCLKKHGNFVMKYYNFFSKFNLSLIYLMSLHFKEVKLVKPKTSRQFSGEEIYILCLDYKDNLKSGWDDIKFDNFSDKSIVPPSSIDKNIINKLENNLLKYYNIWYNNRLLKENFSYDDTKNWEEFKKNRIIKYRKEEKYIFQWFVKYIKSMKYKKIKNKDKLI